MCRREGKGLSLSLSIVRVCCAIMQPGLGNVSVTRMGLEREGLFYVTRIYKKSCDQDTPGNGSICFLIRKKKAIRGESF